MATGEAATRSVHAADPGASRGRAHDEPADPDRSPFQRDCDRIVHSTAFRRLRDKTQVFLAGEGDHYRTRLTHTLEVSRLARALARTLRLDEDLAEAVALGHDLGHPPFGHAGERALDRALRGRGVPGGFDHNLQGLRVVTALERRYPRFDGLNLSVETLEGLAKHNGPPTGEAGDLVAAAAGLDLAPALWPSAEAQVAAIADDIAYDAHDLDDGVRSGLLDTGLFEGVPVLAALAASVRHEHPDLPRPRFMHELNRRLITFLMRDVVAESRKRLGALDGGGVDAVRGAGRAVIAFSAEGAAADKAIKALLRRTVYRHPTVLAVMGQAEALVGRLLDCYLADAAALPEAWRPAFDRAVPTDRPRLVADFIAGMTDGFARGEAARLFDGAGEFR